MHSIRVAEVFAGVGGFRVGLNRANAELNEACFKVVWSNQWEPSTKIQHASDTYIRCFGADGHSNLDITKVSPADIPEVDLLVGGFPCQDYSVATGLQRAGGLAGKKGMLWWELYRILRDAAVRPRLLLLENVDRLLRSPVSQRGRDFAVILTSLANLGYAAEWRVINAADYGMPQRRRRVFILAYLNGSIIYESMRRIPSPMSWLTRDGVIAKAFPILTERSRQLPTFVSLDNFPASFIEGDGGTKKLAFHNAGCLIEREVCTVRVSPAYYGPRMTLGDVLLEEAKVDEEYFVDGDLDQWLVLKGSKKLGRTNPKTGLPYLYSEGGIAFPDPLDKPSRTIVTGEGGKSPSRFKHVVLTESGRYRRLTPIELERLNMFPDGHTEGLPATRRAFLMGNALVTGVVHRLAVVLAAGNHLGTEARDQPIAASSALVTTAI